jgi:hypothetical protein
VTTSSRRPARATLPVLFVAALTAVPVIAGRGASQSISRQGTSLQITLGAADVIVTGDAQETVRLSPVTPPGDATASRVSMEIGDDRVVRVAQTPGAAPERAPAFASRRRLRFRSRSYSTAATPASRA